MLTDNQIIWFKPRWFPIDYGMCPSKEAWDKEMERMKISMLFPLDGYVDGVTVSFEKEKENTKVIVCISPYPNYNSFVGLIVHEAVHVWQQALEAIGEDKPSSEFEAYAIQGITQDLLSAAEELGYLKPPSLGEA